MADAEDNTIRRGSANVFADLGRADAATHKLKADLVQKMRLALRDRGLTQAAAARCMGVSQPDVSRLMAGKFRDVSLDRLMRLLTRLEMDIDITVSRHGEPVGETLRLEAAHA